MARLAASLTISWLLIAVPVSPLDLDGQYEYEEPNIVEPEASSDYSDSPSRQAEALLGSDVWDGGSDAMSITKRGPRPFQEAEDDGDDDDDNVSWMLPDDDEIRSPTLQTLTPPSPPKVKARAVTADELHQIFGDPEGTPRQKKSASDPPQESLFRQYLRSAIEKKRSSVKKKRSVVKRSPVKRSRWVDIKRTEGDGDEAVQGTNDAFEELPSSVRKMALENELLSQENSFLTDALNEATVAQTNGNDEKLIRKEIEDIRNAAKIEAIMKKVEEDGARIREEQKKLNDNPGNTEEAVVVTDNSISDLEECPPVKELATGCSSVIKDFGFRMDEDAADACDAHRICYGCSSTFSASRDLCDRLFMAQSRNLCAKEADTDACTGEAMALLNAMQVTHQTSLDSTDSLQQSCGEPCVKDYFRAIYRPRR